MRRVTERKTGGTGERVREKEGEIERKIDQPKFLFFTCFTRNSNNTRT